MKLFINRAARMATLTLLLLLGISSSAWGASSRTFVSTSGLDTNACGPTAPCRTFSAALALTSAGGEIVVLSSGGYGPMTITQSVSIVAAGVHPSISVSSGDAIGINAPSATVNLSGLALIGEGSATNGLHIVNASSVVISGMSIEGFQNGINALIPF